MTDNTDKVQDAQEQTVESSPTEVEQVETETEQVSEQPQTEQKEQTEQPKSDDEGSVPYSRFSKVYYRQKQAERELAELKKQQAELLKQQTQVQQPQQVDVKPTLDQYDYDSEKHAEALVDWKLRQMESQRVQQEQQSKIQKKVNNFQMKQEKQFLQNPEYYELSQQADMAGIRFSPVVSDAIMESEVGVKVHEFLLKNPDKIEEINNASQVDALRKIIDIEGRFNKQKPAPISKAPAPISTDTSETVVNHSNQSLGKMSPAEYYKYRMNNK